jgi:hypothetical protein
MIYHSRSISGCQISLILLFTFDVQSFDHQTLLHPFHRIILIGIMAHASISADLIIAILFGILQLLVGLISLWQQYRFCQISCTSGPNLTGTSSRLMSSLANRSRDNVSEESRIEYAQRETAVEGSMGIKELERSDSDATVVVESSGEKELE